jgi:hypothetical protein
MVCPVICTAESVSVAQREFELSRRRSQGVGKWEARSGFHFPMPRHSLRTAKLPALGAGSPTKSVA